MSAMSVINVKSNLAEKKMTEVYQFILVSRSKHNMNTYDKNNDYQYVKNPYRLF